ncbi:unnamed protein product [Alopecurus aequalis]
MESSPKLVAALLLALASAMVVTAQDGADDVLYAHNVVRASVGVGPVSWDTNLQAYALSYALQRSADCQLILSPEVRPYGENLFVGAGTSWTGVDAVKYWASGVQYYDHATNTCSVPPGQVCDQYKQLVWRSTTHIGCARVDCAGAIGTFIICSYSPRPVEGQIPY